MNNDTDDDSGDEGVDAVVGRLGEQPGETLTPERLEAIQTAMHDDLGRFIDSTAYFVLGSYGDEERDRLEAVRDELVSEVVPSDSEEDVEAFLMDEIHDISEFFTSKFKLLVSYADHVVGVYEHSKGGHAWEAGYIDQPEYRERTGAFYRVYESEDQQYEAYDGVFAHYLLSMERVDSAWTWESTDDLLKRVRQVYASE